MTRPQPNDHLASWRDKIAQDADRIASRQIERDTPRRTFPRRLAVFLVVAAVLVVVAVAWLVTS